MDSHRQIRKTDIGKLLSCILKCNLKIARSQVVRVNLLTLINQPAPLNKDTDKAINTS